MSRVESILLASILYPGQQLWNFIYFMVYTMVVNEIIILAINRANQYLSKERDAVIGQQYEHSTKKETNGNRGPREFSFVSIVSGFVCMLDGRLHE